MNHQNNQRRPGRPKGTHGRYKTARRDITKTVRFSEEEWRLVSYISKYFHMAPATLIRNHMVEFARDMKEYHKNNPEDWEWIDEMYGHKEKQK